MFSVHNNCPIDRHKSVVVPSQGSYPRCFSMLLFFWTLLIIFRMFWMFMTQHSLHTCNHKAFKLIGVHDV